MADPPGPPIGWFAPPRVRQPGQRKSNPVPPQEATPARAPTPEPANAAPMVESPRMRTRQSVARQSVPRESVPRSERDQTVDSVADDTSEGTPARNLQNSNPEDVYTLSPTVPRPFPGTLEASLDAILAFNARYQGLEAVITTLSEPPKRTTNWPELLTKVYESHGREVLVELLFMVTRWLMPNEIVENREWMYDIYTNKETKNCAKVHLILRYDMQRSAKKAQSGRQMVIETPTPYAIGLGNAENDEQTYTSPPGPPFSFMPNIIPTIIACPDKIGDHWVGNFATRALADKMRHHATELDDYLLITDEQVAQWTEYMLITKTAMIILQLGWLRENNQILLDMYQHSVDYEALRGEDGDEWYLWTQADRDKERREQGKEKKKH